VSDTNRQTQTVNRQITRISGVCRECFLQDADYENAHDAFEEALGLAKTSAAKQALNAFLEATNKASKGLQLHKTALLPANSHVGLLLHSMDLPL
jgi:hypothetical protein